MQILKLAGMLALVAAVAGCTYPATDTERAVGGAIAGGLIASATDNDVLTGAAIGGAAGAFCDNLNVPGCVRR
jgi:osmotically inducible lipoprotein OsmB